MRPPWDLREPPSHSRAEGEWCYMREESRCSADEREWDYGLLIEKIIVADLMLDN